MLVSAEKERMQSISEKELRFSLSVEFTCISISIVQERFKAKGYSACERCIVVIVSALI